MNDSHEAQTAFANLLLQRIQQDKYPSVTQMDLLEQILPRELVRDYVNVLLEKIMMDQWPSNPMLWRLARVVQVAG